MPITYALSRHLYNNNIHCNVQNLSRLWKALREQADYYIIVRRTIKIFGFLVTFYTEYDKYESALNGLLPLESSLLKKLDKTTIEQFHATNGEIKNGYIIQRMKNIKYDTRFFHRVLFGRKAPTK